MVAVERVVVVLAGAMGGGTPEGSLVGAMAAMVEGEVVAGDLVGMLVVPVLTEVMVGVVVVVVMAVATVVVDANTRADHSESQNHTLRARLCLGEGCMCMGPSMGMLRARQQTSAWWLGAGC